MNQIAPFPTDTLPDLIDKATQARDMARTAYDALEAMMAVGMSHPLSTAGEGA